MNELKELRGLPRRVTFGKILELAFSKVRFLESTVHGTVIGICKMSHSQIMLGTYRLKQTRFFTSQPQIFWLLWDSRSWNILRER